MPKVKLTKNELKKQKESLKRFRRYLPMLQLKKQQLQSEILNLARIMEETRRAMEELRNRVVPWVDVFSQNFDIAALVKIKKIGTRQSNIAGIEVPVYAGVEYEDFGYDFMMAPLWVEEGVAAFKKMTDLRAKLWAENRQSEILKEELRIVGQRVNLFEKVKIPESKENIRVIQIYLGDNRTAEVVRGKIAKSKIQKRKAQ